MTKISTHMVMLGNDELEPEKQTLESKTGLLQVKQGHVLQIKKRLYRVDRTRQKTTVKDGISLTMQFIYVTETTPDSVLSKIRDIIAKEGRT